MKFLRRPANARGRRLVGVTGAALLVAVLAPALATAEDDPRVGLEPGYFPWDEASSNIELLDNDPRAGGFASDAGNFGFVNSDLAFTGDKAIVGNFNGFQVYDLDDPTNPTLRKSFVCPGGQGDPSVYGNLLFISVEETRARKDCGTTPATGAVNTDRFRGVRIFDITDIDNPKQLPGVQTCRGSHTATVVPDPDDPANVYVYNSGTSGVRPAAELPGCENVSPNNPAPVSSGNPAQWRIDVIKVPLANPAAASIVSQPRIFTDPATGAFNGLQNTTPGTLHPSGTPYSPLPNTNTCHDMTSFAARELVAGACQGNGILLDVENPEAPVRIDAVSDPNFSYWHSASFNNDGTKVMFTDEWGGGTGARCRVTDKPEWGADAWFDIEGSSMEFKSDFKIPAAQTAQENCVAHNSSLIPVPGRDILVQAWYQGGLSVVDFTDTAKPVEIAYYDRGAVNSPNPTGINLAGFWSTYWYNGQVYGTEISRGFDTFGLLPSEQMSENEIDAAREVVLDEFTSQTQPQIEWDPSFNVAGAYYDQAVRSGELSGKAADKVGKHLEQAEKLEGNGKASKVQLQNAIRQLSGSGDQGELKVALTELAGTL